VLLLEAMKDIQAEVIAWAILLNHYHILIEVESLVSVSAALKYLHGSTSRKWNLQDRLIEKHRGWYKFSDRLMHSEKQLNQTFNYIHYNPIKHGYTEDINEWPWSSFKLHEENQERDWLRGRWKTNPPPQELGRGWND